MPVSITMPALSPTMEEGTLAKWLVKEGDVVSAGDLIAEIETDKATMEVESVDEGTIGKILIGEGTEGVKVNEVLAWILEEGEDAGAIEAAPTSPPKPVVEKPVVNGDPGILPMAEPPKTKPVAQMAPAQQPASNGRLFASPLARRIAGQKGIDLAGVQGSGPGGRIVKSDVENLGAIPSGSSIAQQAKMPPMPPSTSGIAEGSYDIIKLDNMRKTIARRLTESKSMVPHFYLTIDCEIDALLKLRRDLNAKSPEGEDAYKISVNDFIIRASALALRKVPDANASWMEDVIWRHHHADISVAVAIEGGLITPIIREAETKGLATIANEMKDLAERAHSRKLMPEEYQGGTFSVSNLGMFGIREFSAVINPPHGAILAVGAGEQRPVVKDGSLQIATIMTVTLSCDHRVVDGALGAQLLAAFKGYIEDPVTMLL